MIDGYLAELRLLLPVRGRRRARILAEVEEHLRDDAAVVGEAEAIARFGPPRLVASRFAAQLAARSSRRLLVLLAGILTAYVVQLVLVTLEPPPRVFGFIEVPRWKVVPVDVLIALSWFRWGFIALAVGGLLLAAVRRNDVRAAAVAAIGFAGLGATPLLLRFTAQIVVDPSAYGTTLRWTFELWAVCALAGVVVAARALTLSRAAKRLA